MKRAPVVVAVLAAIAVGCATRGSVDELRADVEALRAEVVQLRQGHEQHTRDTSRALADLGGLETRVRDLGIGLGDAAGTIARLGGTLREVRDELEQVRARVAERPARGATPPPRAEAPSRETPAARQPAAEAAYAHARATFRAGEHGQAVLEFLDFVATYPGHPLAANAQYWIGEAYYVQRDYRQALTEFLRVLDLASPSGTTADALLKIGLCHAKLREPSSARRAWQQVISEHPDTRAAVTARGFLRARRTTR